MRFAQGRKSELRWQDDGWPNEADLAKRLGVSAGNLSKFMRGIPDERPGVLNPRGNEYRAEFIVSGIMRWGVFKHRLDVENGIKDCPRLPPRPARGDRRPPLSKLP